MSVWTLRSQKCVLHQEELGVAFDENVRLYLKVCHPRLGQGQIARSLSVYFELGTVEY